LFSNDETSMKRKSSGRRPKWQRQPYMPLRGLIESLEERRLFAVTPSLPGVPNWFQGVPGPVFRGNYLAGVDNSAQPVRGPVAGGVNAIAVDPSNSNTAYIATVGGGVWRTQNVADLNPSWTALTDSLPSLSTTSIAFGAP